MLLKDLCVLDVASCTREQTVAAAARLMRQQHTGDLIVVDDDDGESRPIGILTDRDIVMDVIACDRDPCRTSVGEVMSTKLVVAAGHEDVGVALDRMQAHGVRRLPIVGERERLLGIVTLDDLLQWTAQQADALAAIVSKGQTCERRSKR